MSSDRGTIQRGPVSGTDQQAGWQAPTSPEGRRLPSAPRERRPGLAALAILLIVGGAFGAGFLITQTGKRVGAIEIVHQVGVGQRIPLSAMQEVQVASDSSVNYVPWNEASQVSDCYAASAIPPGTLLNGAMVVRANHVTAGKDVLGLALREGQLPRDLQVGDHIDLYQVAGSSGSSGCPGQSAALLAGNAVVLNVAAPPASTGTSAVADIEVALNPADAGAVACSASGGNIGIAVLPAGGQRSGNAGSPQPGQGGQPSGGASASASPSSSGTRTG